MSPHNYLVGEQPRGIACGAMPSRDGVQRDSLHPHIAGAAAETTGGKGAYFGHRQPLRVIGLECVYQLPMFCVVRDIIVDGARKENPRKRIVEEIQLDFMEPLATAQVDNSVNGVALESQPGVFVVEYSRTAIGKTLRP